MAKKFNFFFYFKSSRSRRRWNFDADFFMYLYLYDSFLNSKKYSRFLAKTETRLTDLGIGGKIFRLSPLRNVNELLAEEVRNGARTIVVVGNDKTLTQIINLAAKFDVILGVIPAGPNNKLASILGVTDAETACDVLAARIIEKIDLGKVNNTYFLSNLTIDGGQLTIDCENQFRIIPQGQEQINICNFRPVFVSPAGQTNYFNPRDGLMEILIQPLKTNFWQMFKKPAALSSIIPFKKIAVRSKGSVPVITDGQKIMKTPVEIEIAPKKLKIIVGKNRMF